MSEVEALESSNASLALQVETLGDLVETVTEESQQKDSVIASLEAEVEDLWQQVDNLCPGDSNRDRQVTVADLVLAVRSSLNGCP